MKKTFFLLAGLLIASVSYACTAVVVAGKYTASGRSMMIKVRDSDERDSDFHIFDGPQYRFVGNTAKARTERSSIKGTVAGYNTCGLCMASLTPGKGFAYDSLAKQRVSGGKLIFRALGSCRNLSEFEAMCTELFKKRIIIAHIAAIDAEGGAAVYEFSGHRFRKFDANNRKDAPEGWRAMTNFSFTGDPTLGSGQVRYDNACSIMKNMPRDTSGKYCFTPAGFADAICRSCVQTDLKIKNADDLLQMTAKRGRNGVWFPSAEFITRYRTALTTTFEAAAPGEDPSRTIMYAQMGSPYTTPLVPVVLASGSIPQYLLRFEDADGGYAGKGALVALSDRISESTIYDMPGDIRHDFFCPAKVVEMIALARKAEAGIMELFLPLAGKWRAGDISDEEFFSAYYGQQPVYFEIYRNTFGISDN